MTLARLSSLTAEEDHKIENIHKTSLKIILGDSFTDSPTSLIETGLKSHFEPCLAFAKCCLPKTQTKSIFALNL